jgi:hypothetical protein
VFFWAKVGLLRGSNYDKSQVKNYLSNAAMNGMFRNWHLISARIEAAAPDGIGTIADSRKAMESGEKRLLHKN